MQNTDTVCSAKLEVLLSVIVFPSVPQETLFQFLKHTSDSTPPTVSTCNHLADILGGKREGALTTGYWKRKYTKEVL